MDQISHHLIYSINTPSCRQFKSFLKSMSLEATLIMLDNSAFSINGDYEPTRWENEITCAQLLIQAKLQANQQSSVGVGLMGGNQVQILCTLTSDQTKASSFLFGIKPHGDLHFSQAIQIGALSLKHRSNETQKQRMICLVGSRISQDIQTLKILAKKLKKNAVAVDIVCFGDCSEQQVNKVQTFVATIQNQDNSHCIVVEPGEILSDKLISSPILGDGAGAMHPGGMGNMEEEDPDLAAAIRMSLEQAQGGAAPQPQQPVIAPSEPAKQPQPQASNPIHEPTEQQLQQLAIEMSLQEMSVKQQQEKKQAQKSQKEKKEESKQEKEDKQKKQ